MAENAMQIGKVAEKYNIHIAKLRDWCNNDLIDSYRGPRNARFIYESEFEKIEKIEEMMNRDPKPTFEEIKNELFKNDLVVRHEKSETQEQMNKALQEAFKREGVFETFEMMATEFQNMKNEIKGLKENQQQFLESKEQMKKFEDDLKKERELRQNAEQELMQIQNELRQKENQNQEKKGFWNRLFGQ